MNTIKRVWNAYGDKFKAILKTYQEIIFWLPPAIGLVFFTRWMFPQLDPRSGIDGLGQLNAMVVNLVGGIMVCFSAWITKRTYDKVLSPAELTEVHDLLLAPSLLSHEKKILLWARGLDLAAWAACFYFWFQVIF